MKVLGALAVLVPVEAGASQYLQNFKTFGEKSIGKAAKWLEEGENLEHVNDLLGSVKDLISGFISQDTTDDYVDQLTQLQAHIDKGMDHLQQELENTLMNLDEDFIHLSLAPHFSVLKSATKHLSQFVASSRSASDKQIFKQQMGDAHAFQVAWDGIVDCLLQTPDSQCEKLWQVVKYPPAEPWLHAASFVRFCSAHYAILSSSLQAVCVSDKLNTGRDNCETVTYPFKKLVDVNEAITREASKMKEDFWNQMGPDILPDFIQVEVGKHCDAGFDGAEAIKTSATDHIEKHFWNDDMNSFFDLDGYSLAVYKDIKGSDKHYMWATGWKYRHCGYNIMYDFPRGKGTSHEYSAEDCQNSNSQEQATCLHEMHNSHVWCLNDEVFYAFHCRGCFFQEYDGGARSVSRGRDKQTSVRSGESEYTFSVSYAGNASAGLEFSNEGGAAAPGAAAPAASKMEGVVVVKQYPSALTSADASSVLGRLSDGFATVGAVAAFFPPVGEFVTAVAEVAAAIFSVLSVLFAGPDPVTEKIKELEKDIMNRIESATQTVKDIQSAAQFKSVKAAMKDSPTSLKGLIDKFHIFVQSKSADAESQFKDTVKGNIGTYINDWNIVADCLSGATDCSFQGESAWQIFARHEKTWYRPYQYMVSVQFYMQLLQQSALAICGFDMVTNGGKKCNLLPDWDSKFKDVFFKANDVKNYMKNTFWDSMGGDKLPDFIEEFASKHANQGYEGAMKIRDEITDEIDNNFGGKEGSKFLEHTLGVTSWSIAVYGDIGGSDKHYMWATGYKYRHNGYNIMYEFSQQTETYEYSSSDCQDSHSEHQATCLHEMHSAAVWCLNDGTFYATSCNGCYSQSYSGGIRMITPGSDKETAMLGTMDKSSKADSDGDSNDEEDGFTGDYESTEELDGWRSSQQAPTDDDEQSTTEKPADDETTTTMAPGQSTTEKPANDDTTTTVAPSPTPPYPGDEACRPCQTMCSPCQACINSEDGECFKCWHCWDWDDDELEDDDDDMDKDCDALDEDHSWEDSEVRCLTNGFARRLGVLAGDGRRRTSPPPSNTVDCRACWVAAPLSATV